MTTDVLSEITFEQIVGRAVHAAARVFRTPLGAHTSEDVVGDFILKQVRGGRSLEEIAAMLSGPKLYTYLTNVKNDIVRWERAVKRGSDTPPVSFEEAEPILFEILSRRGLSRLTESPEEAEPVFGITGSDPEMDLIRKERDAEMKSFLHHLFDKVPLSDIQKAILDFDQKGLTNEAIARELGTDVKTLYARRSEAHRKLATAAKRLIKPEK
jgi:DNA-binding CsgD family transcriptional regulator